MSLLLHILAFSMPARGTRQGGVNQGPKIFSGIFRSYFFSRGRLTFFSASPLWGSLMVKEIEREALGEKY